MDLAAVSEEEEDAEDTVTLEAEEDMEVVDTNRLREDMAVDIKQLSRRGTAEEDMEQHNIRQHPNRLRMAEEWRQWGDTLLPHRNRHRLRHNSNSNSSNNLNSNISNRQRPNNLSTMGHPLIESTR